MELKVTELTRPGFTIEELPQPDGTIKPGRQSWCAIEFTAELDPFGASWFDDLVIVGGDGEKWHLVGAKLALSPRRTTHRIEGYHRFVAIYNSCKRM